MFTILLFLSAVALLCLFVYNGLIAKRIAVENGWSQIDVQLKRRLDLIPNLIETVKGYAGHEKSTLEAVIQARNQALAAPTGSSTERIEAEGAISTALRGVFALAESYPDLKANENFGKLQEELSSTENRIGFARQHFNDSVGIYNTAREQIPGALVVGFGNFPPKTFFELGADEKSIAQQPPKVAF